MPERQLEKRRVMLWALMAGKDLTLGVKMNLWRLWRYREINMHIECKTIVITMNLGGTWWQNFTFSYQWINHKFLAQAKCNELIVATPGIKMNC